MKEGKEGGKAAAQARTKMFQADRKYAFLLVLNTPKANSFSSASTVNNPMNTISAMLKNASPRRAGLSIARSTEDTRMRIKMMGSKNEEVTVSQAQRRSRLLGPKMPQALPTSGSRFLRLLTLELVPCSFIMFLEALDLSMRGLQQGKQPHQRSPRMPHTLRPLYIQGQRVGGRYCTASGSFEEREGSGIGRRRSLFLFLSPSSSLVAAMRGGGPAARPERLLAILASVVTGGGGDSMSLSSALPSTSI